MAIRKQWMLSDQAKYCHFWFKLTGGRLQRKTIKEGKTTVDSQRFTELFILLLRLHTVSFVLPQWFSSKESAFNATVTGDGGSTPGSRRSPGGGHGNPLQYSHLENPMDRGVWRVTVHSVTKSWT